MSVGTVELDGPDEVTAGQDEDKPPIVTKGVGRSSTIRGTIWRASAAAEDEEYLSLMAELSLRAVRGRVGRKEGDDEEHHDDKNPP